MMAQDDARGQQVDAPWAFAEQHLEEAGPSQRAFQERLDVLRHERRESEEAPHAVDDARMAASSSMAAPMGPFRKFRGDLGHEDGDAEAVGMAIRSAEDGRDRGP